MSLALGQIVARLEDPEVPVTWLDPITPEDIWTRLPAALYARGMAVFDLDSGLPITDHDSLLARFSEVLPPEDDSLTTLSQLKERLLRLPRQTPGGWVVMFHNPEALRQNDEETFEDFLEVLTMVHESLNATDHRVFKLVVRD